MKSLLIAVCCLFLISCATTPVPVSEAIKASPERILAYQNSSPDYGHIVVVRDEGMISSGCYVGIYINGTLAARLGTGELASFNIQPGEILLKVGVDPYGGGLCSYGKDNWTQRETHIKQSETKSFRMAIDANGKPDIQRTQ